MMTTRFYAETAQPDRLIPLMKKLAAFDSEHRTNYMQNSQSSIEASTDPTVRETFYKLIAERPTKNAYERRQSAQMRSKLAEMYLANQRTNDARQQWYQITSMLENSIPDDCKDLAEEVRTIFGTYIKAKRFTDAQSLCNNMSGFGFDQNILTGVANGFVALSHHQEALGHRDRAMLLVQRALAVSEKYGGKKTYNYCDALAQYAALLRKSGKVQQANETDTQANALRQELQKTGVNRYG
jgi:hypothetical protein